MLVAAGFQSALLQFACSKKPAYERQSSRALGELEASIGFTPDCG